MLARSTVRTHPQQLRIQLIILGVLLTSLAIGWRTSILYLALPVVVGGALLLITTPAIGLPVILFGGMIVPWNGPGGVNITLLGMGALTAVWLLCLVLGRGNRRLHAVQTTSPALVFIGFALLALVVGQIPWYYTAAAPLTAQLGGLMVIVVSIAAFLWVGYQIKTIRWLAWLTWLMIAYGALHMVGWLEPYSGRYLQHLYAAGTTGSMFWTWIVTLAWSQALFNHRLHVGWRTLLCGIVGMTLYVAYGLNGDWKSGWIPPLISVAALVLFRFRPWGYLLVPLGLFPALSLISQVLASDHYSYATRLEAWTLIATMIRVNPLLGLGPANYYWYAPLFPIRGYSVNFNSHNQYVDLVAQTGLLGLLSFLWLMMSIGWLGCKLRHKVADGFEKAYVYGALAGGIATLAAAMLGDWLLPFVYNVGLQGIRASIWPWIFWGGLVVLERIYAIPPDHRGATHPDTEEHQELSHATLLESASPRRLCHSSYATKG